MQKRRKSCSLVAGASVFVIVLLILVQVLGAPLWALIPAFRQKGWWFFYVSPENPKPGEKVTVTVAAGNFVIVPVNHATVTVIENGKQPFTVYTDESGLASFIYSGGVTVVRANAVFPKSGWSISRYVIVPTTLWMWICLVAFFAAAAAGLIAGFAVFVLQKKSGINTDNKAAAT